MLVSVSNGVLLKSKGYVSVNRMFIPVLIFLVVMITWLDLKTTSVKIVNLTLPVILFAFSGFAAIPAEY